MKRLILIFFLITAISFGQEQEKKEAPWNVMYPEFMAEEAAEYFDEFNMLWSNESPINAKEGRLVAIAVSAAIRCEYCIAAQIEFARKDGANDEEIKAAIQIAAEILRFYQPPHPCPRLSAWFRRPPSFASSSCSSPSWLY